MVSAARAAAAGCDRGPDLPDSRSPRSRGAAVARQRRHWTWRLPIRAQRLCPFMIVARLPRRQPRSPLPPPALARTGRDARRETLRDAFEEVSLDLPTAVDRTEGAVKFL